MHNWSRFCRRGALVFSLVWLAVACGGAGASDSAPDVSADDTGAPMLPETSPDVSPDGIEPKDAAPDLGDPDVPLGYFVGSEPVTEGEGEGTLRMTVASGEEHDVLLVDVVAEDFTNVLGWAFDLKYHPGLVALEEIVLEDVLTAGMNEGRCVAKERGTGRLNIGCARFLVADDLFEMATYGGPLEGPATFAQLRFRILDVGSFQLAFDPVRRLARGGELSIIPIVWEGVTVTITRGPLGGRP